MAAVSHANKCLNVLERVKVVQKGKNKPLLSLPSLVSTMSVKENPDTKKRKSSSDLKNLTTYHAFINLAADISFHKM